MSLRRQRIGIRRYTTRSLDPVTPEVLRNAIRSGNREQVEAILNESPELLQSKDRTDKASLLHNACLSGHTGIVKYLLENGAAIDAKDRRGYTALGWAAAWNHTAVMALLLAHGATIDLEDDRGNTPLHWAAYYGREGAVELLCARGADMNANCNGGFNALYCAVSGGHLDVAKLLRSKGADVNSRSNDGWTALHAAAFRGHLEILEWLIENGAEVNAANSSGQTPLFWAAAAIDAPAWEMAPKMGVDQTNKSETPEKQAATREAKVALVKYLLAGGADVNTVDAQGKTPLYCAAYAGHLDITSLLLSENAMVNAKDKDGWTALCVAAKRGHAAVVKLLLDRGADAGIKVKDIYTPFNYAVLNGRREAAELLLPAESEGKISRARCPGCSSKKQLLMSAPLFVSDQQSRKICRCPVCGAIWSKRRIEWRASSYGGFAIAIAGLYCSTGLHDRHGIAFSRIALVALWTWIGVKDFLKSSKQPRIWVQGTAASETTS